MTKRNWTFVVIVFAGLLFVLWPVLVQAGIFIPVTMIDYSPVQPLDNPVPSSYQPRYISGFGSDDAFTVFFEDRDAGNAISFVSTTTGPTGFPSSAAATNIVDTHFLVKDWPVNIAGTDYAYRGWGAVGNNRDHHFYVSDNLIDWTLVSTFTVTNTLSFTNAKGYVYYGFHDVIQLNGTYYAFGESNQSQTMFVRSVNGTDDWEAFDSIGGVAGDGPLELPAGVTNGWTPSGNFFDLGHDCGYGKIHVDPRDEYFYLAVNTAAKPSMSPADLEAAFIDPDNWTWHDGSTGPAAAPILPANLIHDLREAWLVPSSDPDSGWTVIYDADYGTERGGKALGYAMLNPPALPDEFDYGDAPDPAYPTLLANNGARHKIVPGFFMGPAIDSETDGQPDATATGDDLNGIDDEDGVIFPDAPRQCEAAAVEITVPSAGKLDAWVDFNGDGDWDDAGEQVFADQVLNIYTNSLDFAVPCDAALTPIFARFRLSSAGGLSYDGLAEDGEVEDYQLTVLSPPLPDEYDFGDAPDPAYPTLLANDGARHKIVPGFFMGPAIDSEVDGQPDATATGDDLNGIDDEDGVIFPDALRQCETGTVEITVPTTGKLDAWVDFNADGDWDDAGEQIFADQVLNIYTNALDFAVPCDAALTPIFARFRLSSAGGLSYDGLADDGEVEDYQLTISPELIELFLPLIYR